MKVYGDRIRRLRQERGWSLQDLSERCHLSRGFLHDIEKGRKDPSVESLERIAQALNVSTAYLLGETDDPAPANIGELIDMARKGDRAARDRLIEHFLPLVAQVVRSLETPYGGNGQSEDLISIGVVGLVRGIDNYEPDSGTPIREHLLQQIRCEILMHMRATKRRVQEVIERQALPVIPIPILGAIRDSDPTPDEKDIIGWTAIPSNMGDSNQYFGLQVRGDSMAAGQKPIYDGDVVIVRRQSHAKDGEIAVVLWPDATEAQLRRVYRRGESVILRADNPTCPPEVVPRHDLSIIGVVVGIQTTPAAAQEGGEESKRAARA